MSPNQTPNQSPRVPFVDPVTVRESEGPRIQQIIINEEVPLASEVMRSPREQREAEQQKKTKAAQYPKSIALQEARKN